MPSVVHGMEANKERMPKQQPLKKRIIKFSLKCIYNTILPIKCAIFLNQNISSKCTSCSREKKNAHINLCFPIINNFSPSLKKNVISTNYSLFLYSLRRPYMSHHGKNIVTPSCFLQ